MQNLLLRPFALSLLLLLAGCHGRFTPALPPGKDVLVSQDAGSTKLAPADPRYQELQRWLASNREGLLYVDPDERPLRGGG